MSRERTTIDEAAIFSAAKAAQIIGVFAVVLDVLVVMLVESPHCIRSPPHSVTHAN